MAREIVDINKGYVKIANNLFENIIFRDFTNRERAVICLIIRLSYGFNHKKAIIKPKARFMLAGMYRQDINKVLNGLVAKKVIFCQKQDIYILNKHFDEWEVDFNKLYNAKDFDYLKSIQFTSNVSTGLTKNVSVELTENEENVSVGLTKNNNSCKSDTYTPCVKNLQNNDICKSDTYMGISAGLTKNNNLSVQDLQTQPENESGASDTTEPKDIIKDNINTCIKDIYIKENKGKKNNKNFDPYFNNPVVDVFKEEYAKIFNSKRCYLDNLQITKLTEIGADNPDFINQIPEILEKFKKIKFPPGIAKFGMQGLINGGKWAAILNGEYDQFISEDNTPEEINGWDLGIPVI